MLSINLTSLVDLVALLLTGTVTFVFCYHYLRVSRRQTDLCFAIVLILYLILLGLILYSDNIVPFGVSAWAVPNAATKNLLCCQLMWVDASLILATVSLFALRYTRSPWLSGWKGAWLYVIAILISAYCWTDYFLVPRTKPFAEFVTWRCLVPWQPEPGALAWPPSVVWLATMAFVVYLIWRKPKGEIENPATRVRSRLVAIGVTMWALGGAGDAILSLQDYFGISPTALVGAISMLILAIGLAEEHALTEKEREHVTRRFQSYVDPALVKYVIEHPGCRHIDGELRELTVVFTDLEGFTTITERLREGAVDLLNEYLKLMTPLIRDHNGYRNKFLGDGMMFFYGAPEPNPDHAIHAVATVLKMQLMMEKLNEVMQVRRGHLDEALPTLRMRTGVSTGKMIVGDAGPEDASDYTVLGDTVNLGSRLESANKAVGTRILLSERTVELLPPDLFLIRPIARLQVVGVTRPVMTYEPIAYAAEATDLQRRTVDLTREIVECFFQQDFEACLRAVECYEGELGSTKLTALYRKYSERFRSSPPPTGFEGQFTLSEK